MNLNIEILYKKELIGAAYIRNPNFVSNFLLENFKDKKLLIFGTGKHTLEVLENKKLKSIVVGILEEEMPDPGYVSYHFEDVNIYNKEDLKKIDFDFIVLLGNWNQSSLSNFQKQYDLNIKKILLPYKIKQLNKLILDDFLTKGHSLNISEKKPNLCLIIAFDRKDFFTICADTLSKHFNLIKIYIQESQVKYIEYFNQILQLNVELLPIILNNKYKPEIVILWITSPLEFWIFYYLKQILPKSVKLVSASSDFYFTVYNFDYKLLGKCNQMDEELSLINYEAEKFCLENSDGIITNYGGDYIKKVQKYYNKNIMFCNYFANPKKFIFKKKNLNFKNIHLCHCGNVEFIEGKENPVYTYSKLDSIFQLLLEQKFYLHIFPGRYIDNDHKGDYIKLKNKFNERLNWYYFTPNEILQEKISKFDFGLVVFNYNKNIEEVYALHFKSLFQAKVISYIAAGIPIIVLKEYSLLAEFVEDHKIGFSIRFDELSYLKEKFKKYNYIELKENVLSYQNQYKNEHQDIKIVNFLKELL